MAKRRYKQFCPTARALDIVGDRWTLLIVRNLLLGPHRYSDLRGGLPGMASNLLAVRLAEMEDAHLIVKQRHETPRPRDVYVLTERGRVLQDVVLELARFGLPYLDTPTDEEPMMPEQVPLGLLALIHPAELPDEGLSIRCDLDEGDLTITLSPGGKPGARLTLRERVRVHPTDPAVPVDATLRGSMVALLWIRQGEMTGDDALDQGLLSLEGEPRGRAAVRRMYRFDAAPVGSG